AAHPFSLCLPRRRHTRPPPSPSTTLFRSSNEITIVRSYRGTSPRRGPRVSVSTSAGPSVVRQGSTRASAQTMRASCVPGLVSRRSEEHTSELQSHLNLVCRLLLEKKNKIT